MIERLLRILFDGSSAVFLKVRKQPSQVSPVRKSLIDRLPVWNLAYFTKLHKFHRAMLQWVWNLVNPCEGLKFHSEKLIFRELSVCETCEGCFLSFFYPKSSFTLAEMARPSASPASFLVAVPITLPISFGPSAPTSAMIAFKAASSSSALICFGK